MTVIDPIAGPAGRLHVDDGGDGGTPVVFVHSFAGSGSHWAAQLAHLRPARRAVALDLHGHGRSASGRDSWTVSDFARDIATAVDGLELDTFVLVGHSLGGSAAILHAAGNPDRVPGLVLVGTPGQSMREQSRAVMASLKKDHDGTMDGYWRKLLTGARPDVESRIRTEMRNVPREVATAIIGAVFEYDPAPDLSAYNGPKLIVDTEHSEAPRSLHRLFPEIPRRLMRGTSHWPQMDKPAEFNRILDAFLAGVDGDVYVRGSDFDRNMGEF